MKDVHIGRISFAARPTRGWPAFTGELSSVPMSSEKTGVELSSGPFIRLLSKTFVAMSGILVE